jgi:hypothetical protein
MHLSLRRAGRLSCRVFLLALGIACGDTTVAPTPSMPAATRDETPTTTTTTARYNLLQRTTELDRLYWVGEWIQPSSGSTQTIKIQKAGIKIEFPPGSVAAPIYVVIVAHPGKVVSYEFFPHGTTFLKPIKIQQDLRNTQAFKNASIMSALQGGYLANGYYDIDFRNASAPLAELFPVEYFDDSGEFTKTTPALVKFYTHHFSGYTLASGLRPMTAGAQ